MGDVFSTLWRYPQQMDVWLAPSVGSDANSGLVQTKPVATLQTALQRIPLFLTHPVLIHCESADYDISQIQWPTIFAASRSARVWIIGDGAGQPGDDGTTTVETLTVEAGTTSTNIVTLGLGTATAGMSIEVLTGALAGQRRTILETTTGNTVAVLGLATCSYSTLNATALAAGATFRVFVPAVRFVLSGATTSTDLFEICPNMVGADGNYASGSHPLVGLVNVALGATGSGIYSVASKTFVGFGVYQERNTAIRITNSKVVLGSVVSASGLVTVSAAPDASTIPTAVDELLTAFGYSDVLQFTGAWNGYGLGSERATGLADLPFLDISESVVEGIDSSLITSGGNVMSVGRMTNGASGAKLNFTALRVEAGMSPRNTQIRAITLVVDNIPPASITQTLIAGSAAAINCTTFRMTVDAVNNPTRDGIITFTGAALNLGATPTFTMGGGAGAVAIDVTRGGYVRFTGAPTISGAAGGDTLISDGEYVSYGVAALGPLTGAQAAAAYAAAGDGFGSAIGGIQRTA